MPPPPRREGDRDATITCNCSKRRRLARDGSDGGDGEEVRPWASLAEDLVELIGWRVLAGDLLDYVRFRAVCSHWTKSTLRPRGRGIVDPRFHPRRWMMLPEGHGLYPGHPNLGGYVRFFSLSTGRFVRVHLPLFDDHIVLDSVDGLLLLLLRRGLLRGKGRGRAARGGGGRSLTSNVTVATNCYAAADAFTLAGVVYLTKWVWNFGFVWGPLILVASAWCLVDQCDSAPAGDAADMWGRFGSRVARQAGEV